MLPTAVYVIKTIIRAIRKTGRGMAIVADSYLDARDFRRATRGKYLHIGE